MVVLLLPKRHKKKRPKRAYLLGFCVFYGVSFVSWYKRLTFAYNSFIKSRHFLHIIVLFCTFHFPVLFGLFCFNLFIFNVFQAFFVICYLYILIYPPYFPFRTPYFLTKLLPQKKHFFIHNLSILINPYNIRLSKDFCNHFVH